MCVCVHACAHTKGLEGCRANIKKRVVMKNMNVG